MNDSRFIRCKLCNRPLKTETAQINGYGPICYNKILNKSKSSQKELFTSNELQDRGE